MKQSTIKTLNQNQVIRPLTAAEKKVGRIVMGLSLEVKKKEKVLVVTDNQLTRSEGAIFFESAKDFASKVSLVEIQLTGEHGREPPQPVAKMMLKSDLCILVTTFSLSHTQARVEACLRGARIVSLPGITREIILRTLTTDYRKIAQTTVKLAQILTQGQQATITSPAGTNLSLALGRRKAIADTGIFTKPGDFGNLPAGEAFCAPLEGTAKGTIVFEKSIADIHLIKPIIGQVRKGLLVSFSGDRAAKELRKRLNKSDPLAKNIGEFGIGTNPKAKLTGNLLEMEKVKGTVHLALGNNKSFGGKVQVPFHNDGMILKPTVKIDQQLILKEGRFLV
ncbi:aminopeptidase [Patescibacteria group bacterium]